MRWRWALRDLLRHRVRTALSLLGVAIATALLLDMVMLSGGIERSFSRLLQGGGFELRATPRGTMPFDTDATIADAGELTSRLRHEAGVAAAGAVLATSALGRHDSAAATLVVYGVTPEAQGTYHLLRGSDLLPADTTGVLLGEPSAQRLHAETGDTISLAGQLDPRVATASVNRAMVVRGIARYIYDARDQPSVAVTLPVAQRLAGHNGTDRASMLLVRLANPSQAGTVAARLRTRFPAVTISSIADMMAQFRLRLSYFRQLSLILGVIALLVTVLLVTTLLAISVNERIGDIAALRAIGVGRYTIVRQIMTEGALLTAVGGMAGVVLGLGTARWLDAILTSFPGLPAAISFFVADAHQLGVATATLAATGILAGLVPAWRAVTRPIAITLRSEAP